MTIFQRALTAAALFGLCWVPLTARGQDDETAVVKSLLDRGGRIERGTNGDISVREIYLNKNAFGDDDLALVGRIKSVRNLNLQGSKITNEGLKHLAGLDALEQLDLYRTDVTPAGFPHLTALKSLNYLTIPHGAPSDDTFQQLLDLGLMHKLNCIHAKHGKLGRGANIDQVTHIQFDEWRLSPEKLKEMKIFKSLTSIALTREQTTDALLRGLREANLLHMVDQAESGIYDHPPASLDEVTYFRLMSRTVTDKGLKELLAFRKLKSLLIFESTLTDTAMPDVAKFPELETLSLNTRITDEGLKAIEAMPKLKIVALQEGSAVTDAGMKSIARIPNLENLTLYGTQISPVGIRELKGTKVKELALSRESVTDDMIHVLCDIDKLAALRFVHGQGKRATTRDEIVYVRLADTRISDASIPDLKTLTSAKVIDLGKTKVTAAGVAELQQALPNAKVSR